MAIFKFCTILINDVNPSLLRTSFLAPFLASFLAGGEKYNAARNATGLSIAKQRKIIKPLPLELMNNVVHALVFGHDTNPGLVH